ncbi:MAG: hypothetical protein ABJH45_05210, partial [Paracoccaceae bacterium]
MPEVKSRDVSAAKRSAYPDRLVDSSDWANRLKEARAKREMLLSKAGAAEMHAAAKHIEPVRAGDGAAPVDDTCDVRPEVAV